MDEPNVYLPEKIKNWYYGRAYKEFPELVSVNEIEDKINLLVLTDLVEYYKLKNS